MLWKGLKGKMLLAAKASPFAFKSGDRHHIIGASSALELIPTEIIFRILQICQDEDFTITFQLARLNRFFYSLIYGTPALWKYVDLELEFTRRDQLRDFHLDALLNRIDSQVLPHISVIELTANSSITYKAVESILIACPNLRVLDLRYCYKIDIITLDQVVRKFQPPVAQELEKIRLAHSGQGTRYYCGISLSQETRRSRLLVFNAASSLEKSLDRISKRRFKLDYVPCERCFDRLSVDDTPICQSCQEECLRVCDRCESFAYRQCAECLFTTCIPCDNGKILTDFTDNSSEQVAFLARGTPHFIFPVCSLRICYEHHGRGNAIRSMVVCRETCLDKKNHTCVSCGFWACPRSRKCEYEMTALRSFNRLMVPCIQCGLASCGLCIDQQSHPCTVCGTSCSPCLTRGGPCYNCAGRLCSYCLSVTGFECINCSSKIE